MSEGVHDEQLVAQLFDEFLRSVEEGRDTRDELLARAGPAAPALRARIALWEELGGLDVDAEPAAPVQLGRFRILRELGHGGLGRVYLAHDPRLARRVALKVLEGAVATPGEDTASVLNEARAVARLDHPGIVKVHEVTQEGHRAIIVMEYVPGPSLARVVAAMRGGVAGNGDATVPKAAAEHFAAFRPRIECLARIAEALAYCHDHGVLHRDIKPGNVLLDAENRPKLIDFGLAHDAAADDDSRTHLTQRLVGTAGNVAPEQVADGRSGANPRSDQFSFSTLAYELVALANPFDCGHRRRTLDAIERCRPRPLRDAQPAVPPDLHRVIHHGLEREPDDRYPDMGAMAGDLRAILESRPITIVAPSLLKVLRLWSRRHRHSLRVAALVGACSLLATAVLWSGSVLRARSQFLHELAAITPEALEDEGQLEAVYGPLVDLKRRGNELDAGLLIGLFGRVEPEVSSVVRAWSRRLGIVHDRARESALRQEASYNVFRFRQLFSLEERLCPECTDNAEVRLWGSVSYPELLQDEESALYRMHVRRDMPPELAIEFRACEMTPYLAQGYYRWRAWRRGTTNLTREIEFPVSAAWGPQLRLDPVPPRPELLARTRRIETTEHQAEGVTVTLPGFQVLDHLVTNAEFDEFLGDQPGDEPGQRITKSMLVEAGPEDPVWVDLLSALRFAQWAGGRVPTALELQVSIEQGVFAPHPTPQSSGEHVSDRSTDADSFMVGQVTYTDGTEQLGFSSTPMDRSRGFPVDPANIQTFTPIGFRVVYSQAP